MSGSVKPSPGERPDHILLLFIDGLGLGLADPDINPCFSLTSPLFRHHRDEAFPKEIIFSGYALGLDANLGVEGLPQSATGQTALLTGVNAAAAIGRHLNGFPNEALRQIIAVHSILKICTQGGLRAAFLNTFRPPFFDLDPFQIIRHLSVTTVCNLYAGLRFFDLEDLKAERSVYQDLTGASLREMGFEVPLFTPEKAGEIVARASSRYAFCLFEYFQTDIAGHSRSRPRALQVLGDLAHFLNSLLHSVDLTTTLVVVCSDHGNIEDLRVKGHTRNPAMALLFGCGAAALLPKLRALTDVAPALLHLHGLSPLRHADTLP